MIYRGVSNLRDGLRNIVDVEGRFKIIDADRLRGEMIDDLAWTAAFSEDRLTRDAARWVIIEAARRLGLWLASIQELYEARARDEYIGVTVPAINIRCLTYDVARAVFRARKKLHTELSLLLKEEVKTIL